MSEKKADTKQAEAKQEQDQLLEMTDLLKRTQANFENYRKQTEKRVEEVEQFAGKRMLLQLLPIIDNWELAMKKTDLNKIPADFREGMELIYAQFLSFLEQNGVKAIPAKEKFDPYVHEPLMKIESEKQENTILEVFQKGYTLHNKVLRQAKVALSSGNHTQKKENNKA